MPDFIESGVWSIDGPCGNEEQVVINVVMFAQGQLERA